MRHWALGFATMALSGWAFAKPKPHPPKRPSAPLSMLPSLARVRVEIGKDQAVVVHDVLFPKGEWVRGDIRVHAAFGAPEAPKAVDAVVIPLQEGELSPRLNEVGEIAHVEPAPHAPPHTHTLLGKPNMAGVTITMSGDVLRKHFQKTDRLALRIRSLARLPIEEEDGAHAWIVRLGAPQGIPLTLHRIEVVASAPRKSLLRADGNLCGIDADPFPLRVENESPGDGVSGPKIHPAFATRHASDDLCLRVWFDKKLGYAAKPP